MNLRRGRAGASVARLAREGKSSRRLWAKWLPGAVTVGTAAFVVSVEIVHRVCVSFPIDGSFEFDVRFAAMVVDAVVTICNESTVVVSDVGESAVVVRFIGGHAVAFGGQLLEALTERKPAVA